MELIVWVVSKMVWILEHAMRSVREHQLATIAVQEDRRPQATNEPSRMLCRHDVTSQSDCENLEFYRVIIFEK